MATCFRCGGQCTNQLLKFKAECNSEGILNPSTFVTDVGRGVDLPFYDSQCGRPNSLHRSSGVAYRADQDVANG